MDRIRQAYDPDRLRQLTHRLADLLGDHFRAIQQSEKKVLNWVEPQVNVDAAKRMLSESSGSIEERFVELVEQSLARGHNLHDPRYIGHQVPAPVPIAGLFDALGSVTNQVMAIYEMGPWATAVERSMVEQLGTEIGWTVGAFAGLVTHGGSLGNLTALLTARNVKLGSAWETGLHAANDSRSDKAPVIVAHQDSHYSVARAAGMIGIGTQNVVRAKLDHRRRIDPNQLDQTLSELKQDGVPIVAVSASSCATPIGAFDPLVDIADVCQRHEVWLHVDAAHGGSAILSKKYQHLVAGLDQSDSLVWDAHKMMFVPALCAFVFYKNAEHRFETFRQDAPYLFDPSDPGMAEFDSGMSTLECTKRAATFGLWGTWSLFGRHLFEDMVDSTFDLGRTFYEKLSESNDFEPLHEPECNIVAFTHIPSALKAADGATREQFLFEVRRELIRSGEFYIVQANIGGTQALRVTIINPLTTADHLDGLLDAIRRIGQNVANRFSATTG
jgi:L-2,4-diaminobutyrate decarboxylase